ncbi:DNA methyltransferase [Mycobacterium phage Hamulus]|uniref:Uncharacterized protein n=1 Tax=Mycobacterium phage Hamulus TaxID=1340824 RepID=S5Z4R6_9CAUD|nr:DNA methyltransferase [Mycobacterium phage Hamulus]AGT12481.1 hypothetical protein HAMULUS_72 [Mycobacterium phage Hamulus]
MSDRIETVIAEAIAEKIAQQQARLVYAEDASLMAKWALAALKAARIAVVELPEPDGRPDDDDGQVHYGDCGDIRVDTTARGTEFPLIYIGDTPFDPETLRRDAAEMLAAVDEAEK